MIFREESKSGRGFYFLSGKKLHFFFPRKIEKIKIPARFWIPLEKSLIFPLQTFIVRWKMTGAWAVPGNYRLWPNQPVHTNGTLTMELRPGITEIINIQRVIPFHEETMDPA